MKKMYLGLALLAAVSYNAQAQLGDGGLPLSMQSQTKDQYVPVSRFALPDWETARQKREQEEQAGFTRPYLVALPVAADIRFPASGTLVKQDNGQQIWKVQIKMENAPALGFNYDEFSLPKGVKLYMSNANGQHVIGAYTYKNNSEDGHFANEPVQGGLVNIEMDIDRGVNLDDIKLHIYKVFAYFRSYEYLNQYASDNSTAAKPTGDPDPFNLEGSSSTCGINAICPLGSNYPKQRKATVQILSDDGACSATMINNTGNSLIDCKQYLLTATHCDAANSTASSHFSELLIRFNFERTQCQGGPSATVNTMTGANFRARANYVETTTPEINGDFLLLELRTPIPASWDIYLAGWNRATSMPTLTYPKKYIGFHHPAADIKKVSSSLVVSPNGEAGGSLGAGTHWQVYPLDSGGVAGGSSGSGLFDGDGRLIGIASVAGDSKAGCGVSGKGGTADFFQYVAYSKLSLDWDYSLDGTDNMRRLQPWLDPGNTGVITIDAVKSNCTSGVSGISNSATSDFSNSISLYPNPVTGNNITAKVNFKQSTDLTVEIYNVAGARQAVYNLTNAYNGSYTFNMSGFANGMYLIKFSNGDVFTTKKVMLSR